MFPWVKSIEAIQLQNTANVGPYLVQLLIDHCRSNSLVLFNRKSHERYP